MILWGFAFRLGRGMLFFAGDFLSGFFFFWYGLMLGISESLVFCLVLSYLGGGYVGGVSGCLF